MNTWRAVDIPPGTASLAVSNDTATNDLTEALKLAAEPVFVDVPAHVANEEVGDALASSRLFGLGLFHGGLSSFLSLALLGGSLFFLIAVRGVGARVGARVRAGVGAGVGVVRSLLLLECTSHAELVYTNLGLLGGGLLSL